MASEKILQVSPYTLLSRWFLDGSATTEIPKECIKAVSPLYLLMYFQASPYICYISKHFNNYGLFQMPKEDIFRFMKLIISHTGYKAPFIKSEKVTESALIGCLKRQYNDLKTQEVGMLVDIINESEEKESIYEMFGLYKPKTKKVTAAEKKKRLQQVETAKKIEESKKETNTGMMSFEDLMSI